MTHFKAMTYLNVVGTFIATMTQFFPSLSVGCQYDCTLERNLIFIKA